MSSNWPPHTSTIEVHHRRVRQRPSRPNRVSSSPNASTEPTRSVSAANSASPQTSTALLTACQSQPNSAATSDTARASRPTAVVAQRPALVVNAERAGAITSLVSVNEPVAQPTMGQRQRHLCHTNRNRPPKGRQVHQPHRSGALGPHQPATTPTPRPAPRPRPDMHHQQTRRLVVNADHVDITQPNQQLTNTRRILFHRGPPQIRCMSTPILEAPTHLSADPVPA